MATDQEIYNRISERFEIFDVVSNMCIQGQANAMICSGPPGIGKSYTLDKILSSSNTTHKFIKGYSRATGLYRLLYEYQHAGNVLVFDDCDSIFQDDIALNLMKSVLDTTETRTVSWMSEYGMFDNEGNKIPSSFNYNGSIIFLTNIDFSTLISKKHKLSPHLEALMSRSHYIDLSLKTKRDYLIRIVSCIRTDMLQDMTKEQREEIISYISMNYMDMRELSLRMVHKLSNLYKNKANWKRIADITLIK